MLGFHHPYQHQFSQPSSLLGYIGLSEMWMSLQYFDGKTYATLIYVVNIFTDLPYIQLAPISVVSS